MLAGYFVERVGLVMIGSWFGFVRICFTWVVKIHLLAGILVYVLLVGLLLIVGAGGGLRLRLVGVDLIASGLLGLYGDLCVGVG